MMSWLLVLVQRSSCAVYQNSKVRRQIRLISRYFIFVSQLYTGGYAWLKDCRESNPFTVYLVSVVHLGSTVPSDYVLCCYGRLIFLLSLVYLSFHSFGGKFISLICFITCTNSRRTVTMSGNHGATCPCHWLLY